MFTKRTHRKTNLPREKALGTYLFALFLIATCTVAATAAWTTNPAPPTSPTSTAPLEIEIIPAGAASPDDFLDVVLPLVEGEAPAMSGLQPLAAVHNVGASVTGGCQVLFVSEPFPLFPLSGVHVYIYSVDISTRPESVVLLDHWMATYDRATREYQFSWNTNGLTAGYYDLRLSFEDGSSQTFRIQLTSSE
jgi:hypothetical protein